MKPPATRKIVIPELEEAAAAFSPIYRIWTSEEDNILRAYYGRVDANKLAKYFNRSKCAIQSHAMAIGITTHRKVSKE